MSWCFRITLSAVFFIASIIASSIPLESATFYAEVPIINKCNGIPELFKKDWHYRNTFGVIIKAGTKVSFELQNAEFLEEDELLITCLQNTIEEADAAISFQKDTPPFAKKIVIKATCVPTVAVLKLCNSTARNMTVSLTSTDTKAFQRLPHIEFKSFETYDYHKTDSKKFLDRIKSFGFVRTPRAQVVIGKVDVDYLRSNNLFVNGLKRINDVIEKYLEYSGRTLVPIADDLRVNMDLEKHVLLFKSEQCTKARNLCNFITDSKSNNDYDSNTHNYKIGCDVGGYYKDSKVVTVGKDISALFPNSTNIWLLLHEIGHHFDLYFVDAYINVQEVWNNIYAAFYQSRFLYQNDKDYWMLDNIETGEVEQLYDSGTTLDKFDYCPRAHFLMALFTLDNHEASVFRSYNLRAMNDKQTKYNILKSIAIFIKDQYNINVAHYIERVMNKTSSWLNLTNIYDLADSRNFRMPCFYYSNETSSPIRRYQYVEHYLKFTTKLYLCATVMDTAKRIKITIGNAELINKTIRLNSVDHKVMKKSVVIVMNSRDTAFVLWGVINKTAVVSPTYTFCSPKTEYTCSVEPEILTYDDKNPSQLFCSAFRFDILGINDDLIALLLVDIKHKKMTIKTLVEKGHPIFHPNEGAYVVIELYNSLTSTTPVVIYNINGTDMPIEEKQFDVDTNYMIKVKAREPRRVQILDYTLNDFETNTFKIDNFGVAEFPAKISKIRNRFIQKLSNDLEYKPYLKKYQHLTDLLRILQTANGD